MFLADSAASNQPVCENLRRGMQVFRGHRYLHHSSSICCLTISRTGTNNTASVFTACFPTIGFLSKITISLCPQNFTLSMTKIGGLAHNNLIYCLQFVQGHCLLPIMAKSLSDGEPGVWSRTRSTTRQDQLSQATMDKINHGQDLPQATMDATMDKIYLKQPWTRSTTSNYRQDLPQATMDKSEVHLGT
jgi:hypothetical protein